MKKPCVDEDMPLMILGQDLCVLRSEPKNFFAVGSRRLVKRYTIGVGKVCDNAEKFHTFDSALYTRVKYHERALSRSSRGNYRVSGTDVCITLSVCTLDLTSCGELNFGKEQFARVISYPYLEASLL